jgi:hypothetical protein
MRHVGVLMNLAESDVRGSERGHPCA